MHNATDTAIEGLKRLLDGRLTPNDAFADQTDSASDVPLPLVARWVVELRSDGTRTAACAAAEDLRRRESATLAIDDATTLQLILTLAQAIASLPSLTRESPAPRVPYFDALAHMAKGFNEGALDEIRETDTPVTRSAEENPR